MKSGTLFDLDEIRLDLGEQGKFVGFLSILHHPEWSFVPKEMGGWKCQLCFHCNKDVEWLVFKNNPLLAILPNVWEATGVSAAASFATINKFFKKKKPDHRSRVQRQIFLKALVHPKIKESGISAPRTLWREHHSRSERRGFCSELGDGVLLEYSEVDDVLCSESLARRRYSHARTISKAEILRCLRRDELKLISTFSLLLKSVSFFSKFYSNL